MSVNCIVCDGIIEEKSKILKCRTRNEVVDGPGSASHPTKDQESVFGENSLEGIWHNQLGSTVSFAIQPNGTVHGEYRTAVESVPGAAGALPSPLKGFLLDTEGNAGAFSVVWKNGSSATSWIVWRSKEQDGSHLRTTWLLQSKVNTCLDFWKSTRINQDHFTRNKQFPGQARKARPPYRGFYRTKRQVSPIELGRTSCTANGQWVDESGTALSLSFDSRHVRGLLFPKEKLGILLGSDFLKIYGNGIDDKLVFGFTAVHGWERTFIAATGQCIRCDNGEDTLHLTWLLATQDNEKRGVTAPMFGSMMLKRRQ